MKTTQGSIRPRSAAAPMASATLHISLRQDCHTIESHREVLDIRDSREHALINSEQKVWDLGIPDGGVTEDIAKAYIVKVAQELAGSVAERKTVPPEKPLCRGCAKNQP